MGQESLVDGEIVCLGLEPERGLAFSANDGLRVEMIHEAAVDEPPEVGVLVLDVAGKERELEGVHLSFGSAQARIHSLVKPSVEGEERFEERLAPTKSRAEADLVAAEELSLAPGFEQGHIGGFAYAEEDSDVELEVLGGGSRWRRQASHPGESDEGFEDEFPHEDDPYHGGGGRF
jgi:hypothetical protein